MSECWGRRSLIWEMCLLSLEAVSAWFVIAFLGSDHMHALGRRGSGFSQTLLWRVAMTSAKISWTHDEQQFECSPCKRHVLRVMLHKDIKDIAIVHDFLRETHEPQSRFHFRLNQRRRRLRCRYFGGGCDGSEVVTKELDATFIGILCVSEALLNVQDAMACIWIIGWWE